MGWFKNCFRAEAPRRRVTALVHRVTTLFSILKKRDKGLNIRNQTDVNVLNNEDVVINVNQTDAGVSTTTSLLSQAPLNAQTTGDYDIENPRSLSPADQDMVINVNGAVRDQTDVGVSHTIPISAQATTSFNIESSRTLSPFEVVSNGNAHEVRDQTVVDISDTAPLLPQTLIAAQATSSSQIQNSRRTRNLPREGGQNSSGMPSQHSRKLPSPIEGHQNDIQAVITEAKDFAPKAVVVSLGCLCTALATVNVKENLKENPFFTAVVLLCYAPFASSIILVGLVSINHPESIQHFVRIVNFITKLSLLAIVYAGCCVGCIILQSVALQVVLLIVPFISMGFVPILVWICRRDQRPSV